MGLPNLFVIGAPKAGTTSLHYYLSQHPQISMSQVKEPKFYMTVGGQLPNYRGPGDAESTKVIADRRVYEALFPDQLPAGNYAGEATPFYLWDTEALRRIRAEVPQAKLIAVLRDPVMRAYSNWAHLWWSGRESIKSLPDAIAAESRRRAAGWEPFWFYRSLGRYGEQLTEVYRPFDQGQVKVVQAHDLKADPARVLSEIFEFLGLPATELDTSEQLNTSVYLPMGRRARTVQAALRGARRGARLLPAPLRQAGRRAALRMVAPPDRARPSLSVDTYREVAELFEDERPLLASMGVQVDRWQPREPAQRAG